MLVDAIILTKKLIQVNNDRVKQTILSRVEKNYCYSGTTRTCECSAIVWWTTKTENGSTTSYEIR